MRGQSPSSGRGVPPSTQQSQSCPVFEHVQTSSIPRELLLPGELEDTPLNISQDDGPGSVPVASTASKTSSPKDPCVPAVKRKPEIKGEIGAVERAGTENTHSTVQATKEVEIAETPPGSLTDLASQRAHCQTQNPQPDTGPEITENTPTPFTVSQNTQSTPGNHQSFGSQVSSGPVDVHSNYSSQISQNYSQSEHMAN